MEEAGWRQGRSRIRPSLEVLGFTLALIGAVTGTIAFVEQRATDLSITSAELRPLNGQGAVLPVVVGISNDGGRGVGLQSADLVHNGRVVAVASDYLADLSSLTRAAFPGGLLEASRSLPLSLAGRQSDSVALLYRLSYDNSVGEVHALTAGGARGVAIRLHLQGGDVISHAVTPGAGVAFTSENLRLRLLCDKGGRPRTALVRQTVPPGITGPRLITVRWWGQRRELPSGSATRPTILGEAKVPIARLPTGSYSVGLVIDDVLMIVRRMHVPSSGSTCYRS